MQCHEFDGRFHELLDLRQEPQADPLLAAHARDCPPCAALLEGERQLFKGLQDTIFPKTSPGFSQRVVRKAAANAPTYATPSHTRSATSSALFGMGALIAAALVMAVSFVWTSWPTSSSETRGKIVLGAKNRSALVIPGALHPRADNHLAAPLPRHPVVPAAGDTEARSPGLSLPGYHVGLAHYPEAIGSFAATLPGAVEQLDEVEQFAPGIRPLRVSLAMLLQALRSAMPGMYDKEPPSPHARLRLEQVERLA